MLLKDYGGRLRAAFRHVYVYRMAGYIKGMKAEVNAATASVTPHRSVRSAGQRLASSSLLRHNVLLFAANMITAAFSYLFHPVVGHLLGPKGYGSVGSILALGAVLLIPTQVLVYIANKFAADLVAQGQLGQVNYLFRRATRYGLILGVLVTVLFVGLSPVFARFLTLPSTNLMVLASLGFLFAFVAPLPTGIVQGRQQFGWFALTNFLNAFLRVATTAVVLLLGFGIPGVLLIGVVNVAVVYVLNLIPLRDILRVPQVRVPSFKPLLTYSLGAMLALSGSTLLSNIDTILAKHFLSDTNAGYYAALAKVGQTVLFIGGSLVWVMFPKVAALQQQGRSHTGVLAWTMAGVAALSSAVLLIFWLFPGQIITVIFHEPVQVSQQLFWYGLSMLLLALANVLIYYFLSVGRMAFVPILLACGALQAGLIVARHATIAQIVSMMVVTMAVLLGGLVALYAVQMAWRGTRAGGSIAP